MLHKLAMAVILASTTALTALSAPAAASTRDETMGAASSNATYWVEENPPPPSSGALELAAELREAMAPSASGGGCRNTQGVGVCISWTNNQLKGDFYVNYWSGVTYRGTARVYISVNGSHHYKYTVATDHTGRYPVATHNTGSGSSGYAYTIVDTFNQSGSVVGGGISPFQYWP
ncbi:hypothetical protein QTQ03_06010 [Micromonospora sp. WMMA1363]|uniref:hypothetical protein n=1 Tax=Micromonospora sp. WMMA1363 TaxID=3053985 RepID=UPI00259CAFBC|nr:hypothetical protein [Micromonospora sp. WMMA1363]MDM4719172.1 hypothetical protein [Micromonospora sp. WMMA1363]